MARTTKLYRQLEADSGMRLLHITGGLTIGAADSDWVTQTVERLQAAGNAPIIISHGRHARPLSPAQARGR